jgi:hypothetical protein
VTAPPELARLFFPDPRELGRFEPVAEEALPEMVRALLAHDDHMTVTVEAWHNSLVDVHVLREHSEGDLYARESLLLRQRDGWPVQYGIVRIDLAALPEIVRMEIESRALPLGRILIRRHVLRQVELQQLWRIEPGDRLRRMLRIGPETAEIFGRSARILVDGSPTVELLEIVAV